jgi:cell division protein FtsB
MRKMALVIAHGVVAVLIIGVLCHQLKARQQDTEDFRRIANQEHDDTQRLQRENQVQQDLLKGIRQNDPYVVELLAREKLRFAGPGEIAPPQLPPAEKP